MTTLPKIAFLGAGNMAAALLRGAIQRAGMPADRFAATDVRAEAAQALAKQLGIGVFADNAAAAQWADVVVLAVKPQVLPHVLAEIAPHLRSESLLVSIAAGLPIARLAAVLGGRGRIVRAMPNTPALVGAGATALASGPDVTAADLETVLALFQGAGLVVQVDEKLLDGVTGLSGSGPAYALVAIDALADAGVREGLTRAVAQSLAAQTLLGAAQLVLETGEHPAKLKDMVTSPGGTTSAGLAALERGGLRAALQAAVEAATRRARELGS